MAIGDAVAQILGTAQTDRQPASGVEEAISHIAGNGATDAMQSYNGSSVVNLGEGQSSNLDHTGRNMAAMITNATYLRKQGTTNLYYIGGVQTNV